MMLRAAARLTPRGPLGPQTPKALIRCIGSSSNHGAQLATNSSGGGSSSSSSSKGGAPCSIGSGICSLLSSTGPRPVLFHLGAPSLGGGSSPEEQQEQLVLQLRDLEDEVLAANWGDSVALTLNGALWDAQLTKLEARALPFAQNKKVAGALESVRRLFDLLRITEDIRDHLNEIIEKEARSSGIAGTGMKAAPLVENVETHATAAASAFDALLAEYPEFGSKTEESLGFGLSVLRQKAKFAFSRQHHFFF